jgi:dihydropteroate synthase
MFHLREILGEQRPLMMGILNTTPDSFSDGGKFNRAREALSHCQEMVDDGADIIDIGGESTRPGAERVDVATQLSRLMPVLQSLMAAPEISQRVVLSIDTTRSRVAEAVLRQGAGMINDVSAGRDDPELLHVVAGFRVPVVLMHMQGVPRTMQDNPVYVDVVAEVKQFLDSRIQAALDAGIRPDHILIDPGIGFGKTKEDNLQLIAHLETFVELGFPVLLGASRKRFMGSLCRENSAAGLLGGTVATTVLGVSAGVRVFRVHDVKPNRQAADVAAAIMARQVKDRSRG